MNITYLIGAGASHTYKYSSSGIPLPLASDFFSTYSSLPIADDFEVRMGDIANYVRDVHGIPWEKFHTFNMNVEAFMTELDGKIRLLAEKVPNGKLSEDELGNYFSWVRAYDQMIFLFTHVLNETQNGPISKEYLKLVSRCDEKDTIVTLNWDTLIDRVLFESKKWTPDTGYGVDFRSVLDVKWRNPELNHDGTLLLKIHGSTNWLVNYVTRHLSTGERVMLTGQPAKNTLMTELEMGFTRRNGTLHTNPKVRTRSWGARSIPSVGEATATPCCFLRGPQPFPTYDDRYRPGYNDFCYFFPPNDPINDIPMMPLIVPPTSFKLYDEFKHVLDRLWQLAKDKITSSQKLVIIGYSFPPTDQRVLDLLRPLMTRNDSSFTIEIVNPYPDDIFRRITVDLGIKPEYVRVNPIGFTEYLEK